MVQIYHSQTKILTCFVKYISRTHTSHVAASNLGIGLKNDTAVGLVDLGVHSSPVTGSDHGGLGGQIWSHETKVGAGYRDCGSPKTVGNFWGVHHGNGQIVQVLHLHVDCTVASQPLGYI
jgi:hypothetical protein